jgi:hypothetical protein
MTGHESQCRLFRGKPDLRASASNAADEKFQQKWLDSEVFLPFAPISRPNCLWTAGT